MRCWRIDLQRKLTYYLHKELDHKSIVKLESHLLDCNLCRSKLAHLRTSQAFVQQLKPVKPSSDPWDTIEAAITKQPTQELPKRTFFVNFSLTPNFKAAVWFIGGVLLTSSLLTSFFWTTNNVFNKKEYINTTTNEEMEFSTENFRLVSIDEMPNNTEPHVVTEGYVAETRIAPDGDATFKLVEKLGTNQPFIVCEIIDPIKLSPPLVGSKVKVYGVSRYDQKANHKWYEVHPVLNIETIKH